MLTNQAVHNKQPIITITEPSKPLNRFSVNKVYCSEMAFDQEAGFYLQSCPGTRRMATTAAFCAINSLTAARVYKSDEPLEQINVVSYRLPSAHIIRFFHVKIV